MNPTPLKNPPSYAIASVDHALRLAAILQVEGALTVTAAAERLGVARSTAHRVLQMLVYRDFARQDETKTYRPGPLLGVAGQSPSRIAELRKVALPYLRRLSSAFDESINLSIRAGDTTRFIASVECKRAVRVTSREGMVFPLHRTTSGLLYLASLSDFELQHYVDRHPEALRQTRRSFHHDTDQVRRSGFAINFNRSENGLAAIGVALPRLAEGLFAGLSVSLPSVRYDERRLTWYVSLLRATSVEIAEDLARWNADVELAG